MPCIFGPVLSRRLGYSLGVDIVTRKVCTLDCVYCQVGATTVKTLERREWVDPDRVLKELAEAVLGQKKIDYITFSGSGEPTLNSSLGMIIKRIKQMCSIPVAVLTNATLLYLPEVRKDLMDADLVVPSLDAVSQDIFKMLNRPHRGLSAVKVVEGIKAFTKDYSGKVFIEVMIVKGFNDDIEELSRIEGAIRDCRADKIQINSVFRPPAEEGVEPADGKILETAKNLFGKKSDIIGVFQKEKYQASKESIPEAIIALLKRRPCSVTQICRSLGLDESDSIRHLEIMLKEGGVEVVIYAGEKFYRVL